MATSTLTDHAVLTTACGLVDRSERGKLALTGDEALLRWEHPTLGPVPPDEFVALAEHAGMMSEITEFVLDESLRQLADWRRQGSTATVSVNVSASVLQDVGLPGRVKSSATPRAYAQSSSARLVNSVP